MDEGLEQPLPGSRWATAAWIACSVAMVVLVVAIWLRVAGDRAGVNLSNAIIDGKRPAAPALPMKTVEGAASLPGWYEIAADDTQAPSPDAKVMVVNWWASWCQPCKEEAPVLEEISRDYDGKVVVVGMNAASKDLATEAAAFAKKYDITFPLVRGGRAFDDAWGVKGYPETYVVGVDGRISSFVPGVIDEETLRGLVEDELSQDRSA